MDRSRRIAATFRSVAARGYYTDDGGLVYAGRVGTGMSQKVLRNLRRRLDPLKRLQSALGGR
jgi:ATP-dependent DNA ligase